MFTISIGQGTDYAGPDDPAGDIEAEREGYMNGNRVYLYYRNTTELSGGLEFNPGKRLIIRLGCSNQRRGFLTGDFSSDLLAAVSGGVGFQFTKINLDVGFMNLGAAGYVVGFSICRKSD